MGQARLIIEKCLISAQKSRTTLYDFNEVIFGSPAFRLCGIRDFLSLLYNRFGVFIFLSIGAQNK